MKSGLIALIILGLMGGVVIISGLGDKKMTKEEVKEAEIQETASEGDFIEYTARFEIVTLGTKRIFTAAMYHNQDERVFITAADPGVIYVKAQGIIWGDFFETLPFSLTNDCLVTGTKQTFCTGEKGTLRFYLNEVETPQALDLLIKPNDYLQVSFER